MSLLICIMYAYVTWQHHCYYHYNDNNINSAIIIPWCATVYLWHIPAPGLWCWSKVGFRVTMGCDKGRGQTWMDLGPNSSIDITHIEHTRKQTMQFYIESSIQISILNLCIPWLGSQMTFAILSLWKAAKNDGIIYDDHIVMLAQCHTSYLNPAEVAVTMQGVAFKID